MIADPRLPIVVGTLAIVGLAIYLAVYHPSPGPLARAHARVERLSRSSGCVECHADDGLESGCLGCHGEIEDQFSSGRGYHAFLRERQPGNCESCHREHVDTSFALTGSRAWGEQSPEDFSRPHVAFTLAGSHSRLGCSDCHDAELVAKSTPALAELAARRQSFLGLGQDCEACHEDYHGSGLFVDCARCHDQNRFDPAARFDHAEHFPLENAHRKVSCVGCHESPALEAVARKEGGSRAASHADLCEGCHESPHRIAWGSRCTDCHPNDASPWPQAAGAVTPTVHALTGFRLLGQHAESDCEGCHPRDGTDSERFATAPPTGDIRYEETCEACHADVHRGQFDSVHSGCRDCHRTEGFLPSTFTLERHSGFPLIGAHASAACNDCHRLEESGDRSLPIAATRRYLGTTRDCSDCHVDVHLGQFRIDGRTDCKRCHESTTAWREIRFDHDRDSAFPLDGRHRVVECSGCHARVELVRGDSVIQYRPLGQECQDCHAFTRK